MDEDERRGDELPRIIEGLTGQRVVHDTGWTVEEQFVEDGELLPEGTSGHVRTLWEHRDMSIVLSMAEARAMWARARQYDVDHGGRFDVRSGAIILWSGPDLAVAEPVGTLYVAWQTPGAREATITKLEWDPSEGGSEEQVWQAMEVLAGRSLRA